MGSQPGMLAGLNPPQGQVRFLFTRRSLEPKPIELKAPPVDPDSVLAKIREANKASGEQKSEELQDFLEQGLGQGHPGLESCLKQKKQKKRNAKEKSV